MPLKSGSSRETISDNIAKLVEEGYPVKQAVAIAYEEAGRARGRSKKNLDKKSVRIIRAKRRESGVKRKNRKK